MKPLASVRQAWHRARSRPERSSRSSCSAAHPHSATIHSLAAETLLDIFELAHDPGYVATLLAAVPVCRDWRHAAQLVLWSEAMLPVFRNPATSNPYSAKAPSSKNGSVGRLAMTLAAHLAGHVGSVRRAALVNPFKGLGGRLSVESPELEVCSIARELVLKSVPCEVQFHEDANLQPELPVRGG